MKKLWRKLSNIGVVGVTEPSELHSLIMTNRLAVIAVGLIATVGTLLGIREWNDEPIFVFCTAGIFLMVLLMMRLKLHDPARLLLCMIVPMLVVGLSVISKLIPNEDITETEFFDYRYVLLATGCIPAMVYGFRRSTILVVSLIPCLLSILLFDEIHEFFGVGYFQIPHKIPSYEISGEVATVMFCVITVGVLVLRKTYDEVQSKNEKLIAELDVANKKLEGQQTQIMIANARITSQNMELSRVNEQLLGKVSLADQELQKTNRELIKHNGELQQFSYTVSHNLKGPVASIIGLIQILDSTFQDTQQRDVVEHLKKSARNLEDVIKDLSMIIDIRNDVFKVKQRVSLKSLVDEVALHFRREIKEKYVKINASCNPDVLYTVRPMMVSILHNLIGNAIKYASPARLPVVEIFTSEAAGQILLTVRDNGIGIDMKSSSRDLFKLYKRFNSHTEGKGIGLYLVQLQVHSLGGQVSLNSRLNEFTEVSITLPKISDAHHQKLWELPNAEVFYNALHDALHIECKEEIPDIEPVVSRALEFMREQRPSALILVFSHCSPSMLQQVTSWLSKKVLASALNLGLKRIAVVDQKNILTGAAGSLLETLENQKVDVVVCNSVEEADRLIEERLAIREPATEGRN